MLLQLLLITTIILQLIVLLHLSQYLQHKQYWKTSNFQTHLQVSDNLRCIWRINKLLSGNCVKSKQKLCVRKWIRHDCNAHQQLRYIHRRIRMMTRCLKVTARIPRHHLTMIRCPLEWLILKYVRVKRVNCLVHLRSLMASMYRWLHHHHLMECHLQTKFVNFIKQ